jgi:NAD(P)-dependent dehydrogenase (short-subunit alcohol dehydrogenase family)
MPRNLLITGASRGIGAATARLAARQGWSIGINYVSDQAAAEAVASDVRACGMRAVLLQADIGKQDEAARLFTEAEQALGPLNGLVNNAGVTGLIGAFTDATPDMIWRVLEVNAFGLMICSQEAVHRMSCARGGDGGVIVNVSSIAAALGAPGEYVHYAASKAAVEAFTVGLAREVARDGIRVNAVSPGSTLTDIHASAGEPGRPERVAPRIPMGRLGEPDEIAEAIVWLLSAAASYVTGSILRCAGGL